MTVDPRAASLNDCLMIGPPFLNDLCTILLRFRLHNYALSTDIESIPPCTVRLHEADRDLTRFFGPSNQRTQTAIFKFSILLLYLSVLPAHHCMLHTTISTQVPITCLGRYSKKHLSWQYYIRIGHWSSSTTVLYSARHIMGQANFNLQ